MPSPKPPVLIVGNWKMNGLRADLAQLARIAEAAASCADVEAAIALPSPLIAQAVSQALALGVGAQDVHTDAKGAFTGGVSAAMVRDAGGRFTLAGHSERRSGCGETDACVRTKSEVARRHGLSVILCVGEDAASRESGAAEDDVTRQLMASLPDSAAPNWLTVAYEPVWAIGTGLTPSLSEVARMHRTLREACGARLGATGSAIRLLYGGSVVPANAADILSLDDVDGALVGGASLTAETFVPILQAAQRLAEVDASGSRTPEDA